jgi:hypothetical protein
MQQQQVLQKSIRQNLRPWVIQPCNALQDVFPCHTEEFHKLSAMLKMQGRIEGSNN